MTVETPAFFGLVLRKNERTCAYIGQRRSRLISAFREKHPDATLETSIVSQRMTNSCLHFLSP